MVGKALRLLFVLFSHLAAGAAERDVRRLGFFSSCFVVPLVKPEVVIVFPESNIAVQYFIAGVMRK